MKVSLNWLKDFVDIPVTAAEFGRRITQVGLALESSVEVDADTVYELDITTNRPDCLSHLGVAREAAAIFGSTIRFPVFQVREKALQTEAFSVTIADPDLCGRYCGRYIRGVKIGPSPDWLKRRLELLGVRSINNVADITNYVMLELGQPLHAFDADKIRGQAIRVRPAKSGEKLTTLDGVERSLDPERLVIADKDRAIALAGVMGGADTEITSATVDVFIESAWFQPLSVRATARALGMTTEASYRFERGADIEMAPRACDRAVALIQDLAGGHVEGHVLDVFPGKRPRATAALRRHRIQAVLGAAVEDTTVERILRHLGFEVHRTGDEWSVEVPSFRVDVSTEEDLLEEVARHHGFDRFPATLPPSKGAGSALPQEAARRSLRNLLSAAGYSEIYTYSFSDDALERRFYPDIEPVKLLNPMSEEAAVLRTSLLPGMLLAIQRNLNRSIRSLQFYEWSRIYSRRGERSSLVLGATGFLRPPSVHDVVKEFDFFDMKGDVEQILEQSGVQARWSSDNAPRYFHPGRFARAGHIAMIGELHPEYADLFKLKSRVLLAEIDSAMLLSSSLSPKQIAPPPRYPSIRRDFSLLLEKGTAYASVERAISSTGIAEVARIEPFDLMQSGPFPENKYSLSVSVIYQSLDRTLTDAEVESFDREILKILGERLGAELRK